MLKPVSSQKAMIKVMKTLQHQIDIIVQFLPVAALRDRYQH